MLEDAQRELLSKSREDIERETAWKWAARAVAAYRLSSHNQKWLRDAGSYYHEAIEHAAMADRGGSLLRAVREFVDKHVPAGAL